MMAVLQGVNIIVYLQDGRRFVYEVADYDKAGKHAPKIINYGWRGEENDNLVHYPVHQINKVVIKGGGVAAYNEYPTKSLDPQ